MLFGSGCKQSFIPLICLVTGHVLLLEKFKPLHERFTSYSPDRRIRVLRTYYRRGRPRGLTAPQRLGFVPAWHRTRAAEFILCLLFWHKGVCVFHSPLFRSPLKILRRDPLAMTRLPADEEVVSLKQAFAENIQ